MEALEVEQVGTTEDQGGLPDVQADAQAEHEEAQLTLQERVRRDPDFAWEQLQKRDRQISESANKISQYTVLDPYLQAAGGSDELLNYATKSMQIQNIPGLNEYVQQALSQGRIPEPEKPVIEDDPDDMYMDEDTKKVRDELRTLREETAKQLAELQKVSAVVSTRTLESHVRTNVEKSLDFFKKDPTAYAEAQEEINSRVANAQRLAESGDVAQQQMIERLSQPGGEEVLKVLLMPVMMKHGSKLFSASNTGTEDRGNLSVVRPSDEKTQGLSRPGTPLLAPPPKGNVTGQIANSVFDEIRKLRGR